MPPSGRKILVVDDDPWIAKMLEFVASDAGHVAVVCKDGNDALEKFAEVMPDLVLLDVVLPKLDGLKVCEHIKKSPIGRLTPVLVFSGIYRDSTEAMKFGADAFLAKPFTPQQIGQQIKQMLPILPELPNADLAAPPLKPGPNETSLAQEPLPRALGPPAQGAGHRSVDAALARRHQVPLPREGKRGAGALAGDGHRRDHLAAAARAGDGGATRGAGEEGARERGQEDPLAAPGRSSRSSAGARAATPSPRARPCPPARGSSSSTCRRPISSSGACARWIRGATIWACWFLRS